MTHDLKCELTKPKSWFGPVANSCWCADRAEGYEVWLGGQGGGAAKVEFTDSSGDYPPNFGGVA